MPFYPRDKQQADRINKEREGKSHEMRQTEALERISDTLDDFRGVMLEQETLLKAIRDLLAPSK